MDPKLRNYNLLALIEAIVSGLLAVTVFAVYRLRPNLIENTLLIWTMALLGLIAVGYYLSLHQLIKRKSLVISTIILSCLAGINLLVLILATGGLDSPFNALVLLAIVITGFFGYGATIAAMAGITIVYLVDLAKHGFKPAFVGSHLIQWVMMLLAGGVALWIARGNRRSSQTSNTEGQQMNSLNGQLGAEQLKSQVLMNSMGEGVIVIGPDRLIQLFNPAAGALTGWDPETAQNLDYRTVLALKTPDDADTTDQTDPFVAAWVGKQTVIKNNLSLMTKSGRKIAITMTVSPISVTGDDVTGAIGLFRDISEEKEVERQRNEFISTASHEMRTPVAAIEGYIALAMNANVASIDERARGFLVKAHDSTTHLGELFRDLLSITKVEEGKLAGHIEPVEMSKLITDVVSDMQFNAQKHNLTLLLQSGGQMMDAKAILPLYTVMGNPERIREVTMNLIDNALKYTAAGGITVDIAATKDTVVVKVIDTGAGIAAEDIPHLFQKFYRVDNSATRTVGGTGLGLYLCRNIIEAYNGRIWVESEIGKGSSFNYSLPRIDNNKLKEAADDSNVVLIQPEAAPQLIPTPVPQQTNPAPSEVAIR